MKMKQGKAARKMIGMNINYMGIDFNQATRNAQRAMEEAQKRRMDYIIRRANGDAPSKTGDARFGRRSP